MKDGKIIETKTYHEDDKLIELEEEIDEEEAENQKRELDVHDLNLEKLDQTEKDYLTSYLEKVHEEAKSKLKGFKRDNIIKTI